MDFNRNRPSVPGCDWAISRSEVKEEDGAKPDPGDTSEVGSPKRSRASKAKSAKIVKN
jgi:hypothetical protein